MTVKVAPALFALLENFIDYAGLYPPAALPLSSAAANYDLYKAGDFSWMLRWFVVGAAELPAVAHSFDDHLSVLGDADEKRAAAVESKTIVQASRPVYCEIAPRRLSELDAVKTAGCFAKIRTGGLKAEAIPSVAEVEAFISACAERRLAFKATAGLHHPIRAEYPLTYEANAPRGVMHGFLNVLVASAFAWQGEKNIAAILSETDASAFSFSDSLNWQGKSLDAGQIRDARKNFIHSVGSCSFEEPVRELQELGLLPTAVAL